MILELSWEGLCTLSFGLSQIMVTMALTLALTWLAQQNKLKKEIMWTQFGKGGCRVGRERGQCRRSLDPWLFGTLILLFVWWDKLSHWPSFRKCWIFHTRANGLENMESLTLILLLSCNVWPCSPLPTCDILLLPPPPFPLMAQSITELVLVGVYERWACGHLASKEKGNMPKVLRQNKMWEIKNKGEANLGRWRTTSAKGVHGGWN